MSKISSILLGTNGDGNHTRVFTGIDKIDRSTGGFRGGNTYLLAGLEKSGKTSLLLNWVSYNLDQGKKITMVSTEMSLEEVVTRLASIRGLKITFDDSPERKKLNRQLEENFNFIPVDDLMVGGEGISVRQTAALVEKSIWEGSELVVVDNLSTFQSQTSDTQPAWQKVAAAITRMVNLAKVSDIPIIIVLHIKPSITFRDTPEGLASIAKSDDPLKIFEESLTIIKKPSLSDVYGGGVALSQLSGAILLWRPYQKFSNSKFSSEGMIILDSMRHSQSGVEVRVLYDGETGKFSEKVLDSEIVEMFTKKD
jgi:replicative DNA helicase